MAKQKIPTTQITNPYKFSVYRTAAWTCATGANVVPFDTKNYDTNTNVDIVTNKGRYTVPVTGYYDFSGAIILACTAGDHYYTYLMVNGAEARRSLEMNAQSTVNNTIPLVVTGIYLTAGQYVEFGINISTGRATIPDTRYLWFNGALVSV